MPPSGGADRCGRRCAGAGLRGHRPGIEEQQLHVENQEGDRQQVEPHVEPAPRVVEGVHAALVRHLLDAPPALRVEQVAQHQQEQGQPPRQTANTKIGTTVVCINGCPRVAGPPSVGQIL